MFKILFLGMIYGCSSLAFACPDFSGHYALVFSQGDERKELLWNVTQNGCAEYSFTNELTYKNNSAKRVDGPVTRKIDGTNEYWDGNKLYDVQKNVNSQHCDERGYFEKDQLGNLRYSWRFECPAPTGNTPWFTPETTQGWTGQLYQKRK